MVGQLVHFELPSHDTERAKRFWKGLFGWSFSDSGMPGIEYWMTRTGEHAIVASSSPSTPSIGQALGSTLPSAGCRTGPPRR